MSFNVDKLLDAERRFFSKYPLGFKDPEMLKIGKKHRVVKRIEQAQEFFAKEQFSRSHFIIEEMIKMVSRSSMVSLFEKPKLKEYINSLGTPERVELVEALFQRLHGDEEEGFERLLDLLRFGKLAKWSLISIIPIYFKPTFECFMKPTTVKGVVNFFELEGLVYKPTPSWDFYVKYRDYINEMKNKVDLGFSESNAAFSGFLMMSM